MRRRARQILGCIVVSSRLRRCSCSPFPGTAGLSASAARPRQKKPTSCHELEVKHTEPMLAQSARGLLGLERAGFRDRGPGRHIIRRYHCPVALNVFHAGQEFNLMGTGPAERIKWMYRRGQCCR